MSSVSAEGSDFKQEQHSCGARSAIIEDYLPGNLPLEARRFALPVPGIQSPAHQGNGESV